MIFTREEYNHLYSLFVTPGYRGYKSNTREIPNGDGKVDVDKRYLHVALKYNPPDWALKYLARAHFEACRVAEAMGVPAEVYPRVADGTLRVLEYPAGVGSAEHTDFDLFTAHCYRNTWDPFQRSGFTGRMSPGLTINPGLHIGEIGELVGLGPATPHRVLPAGEQRSIVYFAMPDHQAKLPTGATVGEWLRERKVRSRM